MRACCVRPAPLTTLPVTALWCRSQCHTPRLLIQCHSVAPAPSTTTVDTSSGWTSGGRRGFLLAGFGATLWLQQSSPAEALDLRDEALQAEAFEAYSVQDFQRTINKLNELVSTSGSEPRWLEMRGQVLVDGKNFDAALADFNAALQLTPDSDGTGTARLIAGRALAYEGLAKWEAALADYNTAIDLASKAGQRIDPYILNSRGNCYVSLGKWAEAREDYLVSSQLFQQAKGFRGRNGSTTPRLDGAVFSASNAALMLAQLGDDQGAIKEMTKIARRAPGSSDMRAALAALYWGIGEQAKAEASWDFACQQITVGCSKYQDRDWLSHVRRWPPRMVDKMTAFINLAATPPS